MCDVVQWNEARDFHRRKRRKESTDGKQVATFRKVHRQMIRREYRSRILIQQLHTGCTEENPLSDER